MAIKTSRRRTLAVLVSGFLLVGATACGSSDGDKSSPTTAADGSGGGGTEAGGGGGKAAGDPCQWYTDAEMEELVGFPVKSEAQQTAGLNQKCVYDAPANYSGVEITPSDEVIFSNDKAFAKSPDGVKLAGEFMPIDGVGDDAFGTQGGGATLNALKGKSSVAILVSNGGGGPEAGKIDTDAKAADVAKQIAEKVLG